MAAEAERQERTLWADIIALEEGADVAREMAAQFEPAVKQRYEQAAENQAQVVGKIRELPAFLMKEQARHLTQETKPDPVNDEADESAV